MALRHCGIVTIAAIALREMLRQGLSSSARYCRGPSRAVEVLSNAVVLSYPLSIVIAIMINVVSRLKKILGKPIKK